jgi:hypothetical protein
MFSFKTAMLRRLHPGSLSRFARSVFAPIVVSCLFTTLLFTGCQPEAEDYFVDVHKLNPKLIGTWTSEYSDSYTITGTKLDYDDGFGGGNGGTIKYVSNFTATAGVIIIEYDPDHKPTYYDSIDNYGDPAHIVPLKGNFIGIYYKNLKSGVSVQMGGVYVDGGAEKATLNAAIATFTMGNEGTYMSYYGTYSKQP